MIKHYLLVCLKGIGMGAANVIPGVSGGTVALITNVFERLINAIKSFDITALRLVMKGRIKDFIRHTDLYFLIALFSGAVISVFSLANLLGYLFETFPVYVWSFFFGLILASVYFVGRTVEKWNIGVVTVFLIGTGIAVTISLLSPATSNDSFPYLVLCGVAGICSMILPGISGSFVLVLMGNYELIMIDAVSTLTIKILAPVAIGMVVGLIAFSHFLSWVYRKWKNQTIGILTGFIFGSLIVLWPWKVPVFRVDEAGAFILKSGEKIIQGYQRFVPEVGMPALWAAIFMVIGVLTIVAMEKLAQKKKTV
ncbi:MAG: DUF368 domain-containing protein [Chitinispirillaceae bacterium]|nr:DUF368 domain-containing protein [Chitinispirillaceae bacterium]